LGYGVLNLQIDNIFPQKTGWKAWERREMNLETRRKLQNIRRIGCNVMQTSNQQPCRWSDGIKGFDQENTVTITSAMIA